MRRWLVLALVIALPAMAVSANDEKGDEKAAPAFSLKDTNGKVHKSDDFKDKTLVIEWTEPGCPYIVRHAAKKTLNSIANDYRDKGVVVIGICTSSKTDTAKMAAFMKEHKINYPVLMDLDGSVGRSYGATNTPHMFIIHRGKLVYQGAIDNDRSMRKPDSVSYIRQALDELIEGKSISTPKTKPYG